VSNAALRCLRRLFGAHPDTEVGRSARHEWARAVAPAPGAALEQVRWVALDTETSGLDPRQARILSIGACSIEHGVVALAASFEAVLRQQEMSAVDNVLVHGIGHGAQAAGEPADVALAAYLRFARADVVVGYHTLFDLVLLARSIRSEFGIRYRPLSLDLALLLPALSGRPEAVGWELDRWLEHYHIGIAGRHQALGDAFAAAQLFLLVLARARAQGLRSVRHLLRLQARQLERVQAHA
jgi:DNA polymerase-3 subunit epsilon